MQIRNKFIRTATVIAAVSGMAISTGGAANAASGTEAEIESAISQAFDGETAQLDALLRSDEAAHTQGLLRDRLDERGDMARLRADKPQRAAKPGVTPYGTGDYEYTCITYNGQEIGWTGKTILACHGTLNTYISGRHVASYVPDLIPRGAPISYQCAYAALGVVMDLMAVGTTGPIGWATFGSGVLYNIGGVLISCG